jgi:hypothetical protein
MTLGIGGGLDLGVNKLKHSTGTPVRAFLVRSHEDSNNPPS